MNIWIAVAFGAGALAGYWVRGYVSTFSGKQLRRMHQEETLKHHERRRRLNVE